MPEEIKTVCGQKVELELYLVVHFKKVTCSVVLHHILIAWLVEYIFKERKPGSSNLFGDIKKIKFPKPEEVIAIEDSTYGYTGFELVQIFL